MQNNVRVELSEQQHKFMVELLQSLYQKETDLYTASRIKELLLKLGVDINDWTPPVSYYSEKVKL